MFTRSAAVGASVRHGLLQDLTPSSARGIVCLVLPGFEEMIQSYPEVLEGKSLSFCGLRELCSKNAFPDIHGPSQAPGLRYGAR